MATVFLWLNILIFGFGAQAKWSDAKRKGLLSFQRVVLNVFTLQTVASLTVLAIHASPWNLLWTLAVILVIGSFASQKAMPDALIAAADELPLDSRKDFIEFGVSHPALRKLFETKMDDLFLTPPGEYRRFKISQTLCMVSEEFKDLGDKLDTLQCLGWAVKVEPLYRGAWIGQAEVRFEMQDRCAAKWASKFINWKPQPETPELMRKLYECQREDEASSQLADQTYSRMKCIVQSCSANPDWLDTSEWRKPFGL